MGENQLVFKYSVFKNPTNMNSLLKILKTVTSNPLLGQRLFNEKILKQNLDLNNQHDSF